MNKLMLTLVSTAIFASTQLYAAPSSTASPSMTSEAKSLMSKNSELKSSLSKFYNMMISKGDTNKDGKLSLEEYYAMNEKEFSVFSKEKSGELSWDEFKAYTLAKIKESADSYPVLKKPMDMIKSSLETEKEMYMKKLDTNSNGYIGFDELQTQEKDAFENYDLNKDGFLDTKDLELLKTKMYG